MSEPALAPEAPAIDEEAIQKVIRQGRRNLLGVAVGYVGMGAGFAFLLTPIGRMNGAELPWLVAIAFAPIAAVAWFWRYGLRHDFLVRHLDRLLWLEAGTWAKLRLPPLATAFVALNSFSVAFYQLALLGVVFLVSPALGLAGHLLGLAPGLISLAWYHAAYPGKVRHVLVERQ